ncbi:hypothetical protein WOLCODRAFT_135603 [Wolfiporia cocos MD-104 SS10]|uniref:Uncharacterized protein n=1 Tax=Wolfiporia cocos (strain MD-104) TaxID=742152 RepID=A0A2H3J6A5_WOLCO|nr:hypothetical protein WOLCODRAFT_135603 [Wolfiporia cocos MD-104 SS10]
MGAAGRAWECAPKRAQQTGTAIGGRRAGGSRAQSVRVGEMASGQSRWAARPLCGTCLIASPVRRSASVACDAVCPVTHPCHAGHRAMRRCGKCQCRIVHKSG